MFNYAKNVLQCLNKHPSIADLKKGILKLKQLHTVVVPTIGFASAFTLAVK